MRFCRGTLRVPFFYPPYYLALTQKDEMLGANERKYTLTGAGQMYIDIQQLTDRFGWGESELRELLKNRVRQDAERESPWRGLRRVLKQLS